MPSRAGAAIRTLIPRADGLRYFQQGEWDGSEKHGEVQAVSRR
jgi:hypothetical protein